jgi:hypothetical protein
VQSDGRAGPIRITATSPGIVAAMLQIVAIATA